MSDIHRLLASLDGIQAPGECDHCDAYQTMRIDTDGVYRLTVHHDDWCPRWEQTGRR